MARCRPLLLWCVLLVILLVTVRPCEGWLPQRTAYLWRRTGCIGTQELVPAHRAGSARRQAVKSREPHTGGFRWGSDAGWHRALQILHQLDNTGYDASRMDRAWWRSNVKTGASTIDVTCIDCGHRCKSTTLHSLRSGRAPGCFCNGAVPWSSKEGHARCLAMLTDRYANQYDASRMDSAWWKSHVEGTGSTVDVTCRECGHRSRSTTLGSLQSGTSPGCFCNGAVPWSSQEGHARCLAILKGRYGNQYDASRMDWVWWKANIKGFASTLDVTCRECGYRSRSTTVGSLQSGTSPGCFCNGAVPWSSQEGHARCLAMLKGRHGNQYDASRMDWAWWKGHVEGAGSTVDVTCRECGHRSRSTTLRCLQSGASPGCFCSGAVPWSSQEGHARCLAMLKGRYGNQYDASRMDWVWWKANIKGFASTLDVTCRECGYRSRSTTVGSLQSGTSPGCFCNGAVPWSSREGHARCLALLKDRYGNQYDASRMDWAWWKASIQGVASTLDVTCRECGHRSRSTTLGSLQTGKSPGCFCNGAVPWSGREGHARCLAMLKGRNGNQYDATRMDWVWWKANIKGSASTLDVTCRECGYRSRSTTVGSLQSGTSPGCFCNGAVPWSSREGHARCLALLKDRYGNQYDASRMDWAWWKTSIRGVASTLDVTCRECGHRSRSTTLNNLRSGHSPRCFCQKKTEAKLRRWLCANFQDCTTQVQGCTNRDTQRSLPFDFGLYNDTVLIELDGDIGHFGRGWGGSADDRGVPHRDHQKELWAMQQGKVVVRLLQADVYRDSWLWEDFLTAAIQRATCLTQPCVLTQDATQYKCGIYRMLRCDLNCKEGSFLPSHIPYLEYGLVRAQSSVQWDKATRELSLSQLDASLRKQGVSQICDRYETIAVKFFAGKSLTQCTGHFCRSDLSLESLPPNLTGRPSNNDSERFFRGHFYFYCHVCKILLLLLLRLLLSLLRLLLLLLLTVALAFVLSPALAVSPARVPAPALAVAPTPALAFALAVASALALALRSRMSSTTGDQKACDLAHLLVKMHSDSP